jgi:hypothetical protein
MHYCKKPHVVKARKHSDGVSFMEDMPSCSLHINITDIAEGWLDISE